MSVCLVCHVPIALVGWRSILLLEQHKLCYRCERELEKIHGPICEGCGRMGSFDQSCNDCSRWNEERFWQQHPLKNRSIYQYNEGMKTILNLYKFRGDYELSKIFHEEIRGLFKKEYASVDVVSYIPLSAERLYERGYNQAEVFAKATGQKSVPLLTKRHESKQSKKSRQERISGENPFDLIPHSTIINKHILLVDDIYTTGTTVHHAAKVLLQNGATKVSSLSLIRS
jgi:competence protein ComFC